jgi:hypothetical protein
MERENIIAWVAGLFEGEGTFGFVKEVPKSISIVSTDLDILQKVKENFGGKIYKESRKSIKPHWKDAYVWRLSASECIDFFL